MMSAQAGRENVVTLVAQRADGEVGPKPSGVCAFPIGPVQAGTHPGNGWDLQGVRDPEEEKRALLLTRLGFRPDGV